MTGMIERALVSGKPATVAYVLRDMTPADAQTADYAKVLFDDGDSAWLTMGDFRKNMPLAAAAAETPDTSETYAPWSSDPDDPNDGIMSEEEAKQAAKSVPGKVDRSLDGPIKREHPIIEAMAGKNTPLTRENYLKTRYPDGDVPDDEAQLPAVFQKSDIDAEPMAQKGMKQPPKSMHQIGVTYQSATDILDASELPLRDAIERELAPMHGRVRMSEVKAITERLMKKVTKIRTEAFIRAFRHIRSKS